MIYSFSNNYSFLSNFYPATINFEGQVYNSVEHAFQAAKTVDKKERAIVASMHLAASAKNAGQHVSLRDDWDIIKVDVMRDLVFQKFQVYTLRKKLSATSPEILVEGNYWCDNFWGNCCCGKCKSTPGLNQLGYILMHVRDQAKW